MTTSGLAVIGFAVAGWILARLIGSRSMFLLAYGGVIVVAVAYFLARRRLAVDASRSDLPTRVREGQFVEVELALEAKRRLSTIVLEEELAPELGLPVRVPIPLLPPGQTVNHVYTFTPSMRGVYTVGPLVATWSDPFGLTRKRMVLTEPVDIIVHPTTEVVDDRVLSREWEDPPIRPPVSKPWPTGFEFYGMRDYVSGDDPRRIVWRATARTLDPDSGTGRYLVREAEQGITDRVGIFLDTHADTHTPGHPSDTFELAVKVVGSLGTKHLKDGFAVTVDSNGGRIAAQLRGQRARIPLLDALARVQREPQPLGEGIARVLGDPRRDTHIVIVTPYLSRDAARKIRLLMDRGVSVLLALLQWDDSDPESMHRAGGLGCNIVEVSLGSPLGPVFRRVMGAASHR